MIERRARPITDISLISQRGKRYSREEKAASRSGASSSMHVVLKTSNENPKVNARRFKNHVRRSSLSTIRPLLLLVLIEKRSSTVSSFYFHGKKQPSQVVGQRNTQTQNAV